MHQGENLTSVRSNGADCIGPTGTHVNALIIAEDPMVAWCTPGTKRVIVSIIVLEQQTEGFHTIPDRHRLLLGHAFRHFLEKWQEQH